MKFKQISISLCQQGGIGLLPRIVKIDRWYAILDSQNVRPSEFFWDYTENDKYHSQGWAFRQFSRLPQITQKDAEQKMKDALAHENKCLKLTVKSDKVMNMTRSNMTMS